jgi:hypothetical protein
MQVKRLEGIWPDAHAKELDQRDAFRRAQQQVEIESKPRPLVELSAEEAFRLEKQKKEQLIDEAERLEYDDAKAELEKIEKEEQI